MKLDKIQIVSFNNPYPPNYGGVIDVYYKIKFLHQLNVEIYLHLFTDDRMDTEPLNQFCKEIYIYKKNNSLINIFSKLPFGVASRKSDQIYNNLNQNDALILFEGLQSAEVLHRHNFTNPVVVRTHNVEHYYYKGLSKSASNPLKKLIYLLEAKKYKKCQKILEKVDAILPLSQSEFRYFNQKFKTRVSYIPVFHGNETISHPTEKGTYALYHGDLSITDNLKSAKFLVSIFAELPYDFYIASSILPKSLNTLIKRYKNIHFKNIGNNHQELKSLIANAHANVLYSFQATGTKLKVFYALYQGRFCIVNSNIIDDKNILSLCEIADTKNELKEKITEVFNKTFHNTNEREAILTQNLSVNHARQLEDLLVSISSSQH